MLIFIHGTASSTNSSFSDLWWDEEDESESTQHSVKQDVKQSWSDFVDTHYNGRVYALEHDTFTKSPARNAIDLLKSLAKGQKIHLVSHSRGGLIGELLCLSDVKDRDPLTEEDIKRFASAYDVDSNNEIDETILTTVVNDLQQLNKTLKKKVPVVQQFVRVACPIRGTTLASGRLDIYLSVLATAAQLLAGFSNLALGAAVGLIKGVAIAAAKKRLRIAELPGLESMIPDKGFIRLLNDHAAGINSPLTVIAGNAQAKGLSRQTLWVALSNAYYWKKNDFVVESESMQGGLRRRKAVNYLIDTHSDVNHFSYFKNQKTVNKLYAALRGEESKAQQPYSRSAVELSVASSTSDTPVTPRGITIIIPGFAASYLLVEGEKVWLQSDNIAKGRLAQLELNSTKDSDGSGNVQVEQEVGQTGQVSIGGWTDSRYQAFATYLEQEQQQLIISFNYDWRLSTQNNADKFADDMQLILANDPYQDLPVKVVAHSTGGYIALKALRDSTQFKNLLINKHDMQLFLVGTPFNGTYHALEILQGVSPFIPYLAMIDPHHSQQQLIELFAGFPGLNDMLPDGYSGANEALHKQLSSKPAYASRIHYVAGTYPRTPIALSSPDGFLTSAEGDGSARWDEIPDWITQDRVWYIEDALHGNLLAMPNTFQALAELFVNGATYQLSHTKPLPRTSRSLKHVKLNPKKTALLYPNVTDIENTVLRASTLVTDDTESISQGVHIRIVNGNLRFIDHPIVVGHYIQDGIKSAEAVIDEALDGMLTDLYRKNLYPGEIGTAEVVTRRGLEKQAFGAVCVGLGAIGSLTVRKLRSTLRDGFIKYGLHQRELLNNCQLNQGQYSSVQGKSFRVKAHPIELSTLLIGAGSGGISIEDSVMSLLHAVSDANKILIEMHCEPIARLDIVELYEDVAITAARSLQKIHAQFGCNLTIEPLIVSLTGVQKRAASVARDSWWQHLQVIADEDSNLVFSPLTHRAGMDTTVLNTQTKLIETLIEQSTQETRFNRLFSQTLFSLLIPNGLKEQVLDDNGMVLLLNKKAAAYPWEMLVPANGNNKSNLRDNNQQLPFATQTGLIRKLHTEVDLSHPAAINHKAMIIGDPISPFVELPGAQQEAGVVRKILTDSVFDVAENTLIRSRAVNIVSRIMNVPVQILHLAGHGIFIPPGENYKETPYPNGLAGMVLGDDIYLTEKEVQQLDSIPELVFINCCHLGKIAAKENIPDEDKAVLGHSRSAFAANLGTAFIEAGAKCVVAAGWEVDDAAALVFATTFYEHLIHHGDNFGDACKYARVAVYNQHPRTNTWGAYQCYGDPLFRFNDSSHRNNDRKEKSLRVFHSPWELVVWSNNICAKSNLSSEQRRRLIKETRNRADYLPDAWKQDASVFEAIANVFAKIGETVQALTWYQQAAECDNSSLKFKALETKIQLHTQLSEEMFEFFCQYKTMTAFDEAFIKSALHDIESMLALGGNKQRYKLKAEVYRHYGLIKLLAASRRSQANTKQANTKKRKATVVAAQQYMETAYDLFLKNDKQVFDVEGLHDASALLDTVSLWLGLDDECSNRINVASNTVINRYIRQLKQLKSQLESPNLKQTFFSRESLLRCVLLQRLLLIHKEVRNKKFVSSSVQGSLHSSVLNVADLRSLYLKLLDGKDEKQIAQALKPIRFLYTYLGVVWSKKSQVRVEVIVQSIKDLHDEISLICNTLDR
ncbi:MAG: CHAT domain-containing protein [Thiotrichaceae bacterium]